MALNFDIDYVLPFVDGSDPEWAAQHKIWAAKYGRKEDGGAVRYADFGLLRYVFRAIDRFLPWIHQVHLIVASPSQVPHWINQEKVHIVYHADIMPQSILPTYNSSTIEMFLHNIEGLADHFIYANDDMYLLQPMQPEDFFTEDGFPKIQMETHGRDIANTMFRKMCMKEWDSVCKVVGYPRDSRTYLRPQHDVAALYLPQVREIRQVLDAQISAHLEPFRNAFQHQQYLYGDYAYLLHPQYVSERKFRYTNNKRYPADVVKMVKEFQPQIICINDEDSEFRHYWRTNNAFSDFLQRLLPSVCKYEKDG